MTVSALFVDAKGIYPELLGRMDCYCGEPRLNGIPDEMDDARNYNAWPASQGPVVCHPPCNLWVNFAAANWARYGRQKPAWCPGGDDGGCFSAALAAVRKHGGVLEHPASSHAWATYRLLAPVGPDLSRWRTTPAGNEWVCEVWQSAYGHRARKSTWLLYCGKRPPFELNWARKPGTHQCGWFDRNKPTLSKREASATPEAFARELIKLAEWSRGT